MDTLRLLKHVAGILERQNRPGEASTYRQAVAEIERLTAELEVRDRALVMLAHDLTGTMRMAGFDQQSAEWYAQQRMDHARAELAREQEAANADH